MKTTTSINCSICSSRTHSIFCELAEDKLQILRDHKVTRLYPKNETIFSEGSKPCGLFCVFSGLVKIYKTSLDGKEQIVRLAKTGDVLGYRSFFSGQLYAASAQAVQDTTLCFVETEGIEKLVRFHPELIFRLLKKVCVELGEAEQKFQDLLEKTVEERLSHFLDFMMKNANSKQFDLPLRREEIASIIGARPESVIRALSHWRKKGFIKLKAKSITVLDIHRFQ
ncbi:MAG: Crp/Fnr family transcriptional regulator [Deltaproteobacteria bacterium]|nr:Crp/Fnr family transcriptional regulator [Deltaproteobacteria bacterium]